MRMADVFCGLIRGLAVVPRRVPRDKRCRRIWRETIVHRPSSLATLHSEGDAMIAG